MTVRTCTLHPHTQTQRKAGPPPPREHKTFPNEIPNCGHALYPIEMRLENIQRSQLEFIIGGRSTQTRIANTHTHTQAENKRLLRSQSADSFSQESINMSGLIVADFILCFSERQGLFMLHESGVSTHGQRDVKIHPELLNIYLEINENNMFSINFLDFAFISNFLQWSRY